MMVNLILSAFPSALPLARCRRGQWESSGEQSKLCPHGASILVGETGLKRIMHISSVFRSSLCSEGSKAE